MAWTKRQLISQALEEIGIASYAYDVDPEHLQSGLTRMDAMVASWNGVGVRIGYPLSSNPDLSSVDADSGIPDYAIEAVYLGLASRLAASFGKALPQDSQQRAHMAYCNLVNVTAQPTPERIFKETLPVGSGNKPWRNINRQFFREPPQRIDAGHGDELTLE